MHRIFKAKRKPGVVCCCLSLCSNPDLPYWSPIQVLGPNLLCLQDLASSVQLGLSMLRHVGLYCIRVYTGMILSHWCHGDILSEYLQESTLLQCAYQLCAPMIGDTAVLATVERGKIIERKELDIAGQSFASGKV